MGGKSDSWYPAPLRRFARITRASFLEAPGSVLPCPFAAGRLRPGKGTPVVHLGLGRQTGLLCGSAAAPAAPHWGPFAEFLKSRTVNFGPKCSRLWRPS